MDISTFNAIVLPLFATWFIPVAIRDKTTGTFLGFQNKQFYLLLIILVCIETVILVDFYGLSREAFWRIITYVSMPIVGALVFVKYTQKQLFGNEIKFTKWW